MALAQFFVVAWKLNQELLDCGDDLNDGGEIPSDLPGIGLVAQFMRDFAKPFVFRRRTLGHELIE